VRRRTLFWLLAAAALLLSLGVVVFWARSEPRPSGQPGPAADALARRVQQAVDHAAWERTGALRWVFASKHRLLWDRRRGLAEVAWEDERVLLDLATKSGLVFHSGLPRGPSKRELEAAYRYFINDSFWLNPVATLFNDGVIRELVPLGDGSDGLLVRYTSGGVTPGDAYLWHLAADGLPKAWKMWVEIIPVGGVGASWEGWKTLSTGAKVSTQHKLGPRGVMLTEVEGAATLAELIGGEDPFAPLYEKR
jgi:hypothetical protein